MGNNKNYGFHGAWGGYNKSEVHAYIANMAKDIARQNEEWETERAQYQKQLQNEQEESKKIEQLRDELACQYYEALSKLEELNALLTAEQEKTTALLAEKESFAKEMEKLADFELTKESLAKAKVSLVREQKRANTLQREREEMLAKIATLENSVANSKEAITSKLRDNRTLSAENDALKVQLEAMDLIISTSKEIIATEKKRTEVWNAKTDSLYDQIAELEKELEEKKAALETEQANGASLTATLSEAQAEKDEWFKKADLLQKTILEHIATIDELQSKMDELETELEDVEDENKQ